MNLTGENRSTRGKTCPMQVDSYSLNKLILLVSLPLPLLVGALIMLLLNCTH
jgi:hypothetical protein